MLDGEDLLLYFQKAFRDRLLTYTLFPFSHSHECIAVFQPHLQLISYVDQHLPLAMAIIQYRPVFH